MAFTDNCDIFASFHEDGFNRIIEHIKRQRPSLFNYATDIFLANPNLLCRQINAHPVVNKRNNPLITRIAPLPIPGTEYGLNLALQLTDVKIDFHPGNILELPPELKPPLQEQCFALAISICAGIACPPDKTLDDLIPPPPPPEEKKNRLQTANPASFSSAGISALPGKEPAATVQSAGNRFMALAQSPLLGNIAVFNPPKDNTETIIPIPSRELICFCINAYLTGTFVINHYYDLPYLEMKLKGFEIVDLKPEQLESNIECYVRTILKLSVLPKMRILLERVVLDVIEKQI